MLAISGNTPTAGDHRPPSPTRSRVARIATRMRSDLRLTIVTLYCLCSLSTIGSFSVFRLLTGNLAVALADALIVLVFLGLTVLAWRPGWTRLAANLTAAAASASVLAVVLVLGLSHLWVFSALVSNFLMAERRIALAVSAAMVLGLALRPETFASSTEHATFIAVAVMVSLFSAIFAARVDTQHSQLSELAARDGLTGAFNRRSLDHDLSMIASSSQAGTGPHCLAIMDLDNFKALNDDHGHETGDEVLIKLTRIVQSNTRDKDRFYRYGGEEFVLLLPGTTLEGACTAFEKLRARFARELTSRDRAVTVSAGIAMLESDEKPEAWLARADQALLMAKRGGKDRYEIA